MHCSLGANTSNQCISALGKQKSQGLKEITVFTNKTENFVVCKVFVSWVKKGKGGESQKKVYQVITYKSRQHLQGMWVLSSVLSIFYSSSQLLQQPSDTPALPERLFNLPNVTQLINGRSVILTWSKAHTLSYKVTLPYRRTESF